MSLSTFFLACLGDVLEIMGHQFSERLRSLKSVSNTLMLLKLKLRMSAGQLTSRAYRLE